MIKLVNAYLGINDMIKLQRTCVMMLRNMDWAFNPHFKIQVAKGLSTQQRLNLWYHKTGLLQGKIKNPELYQTLVKLKCKYNDDIEKDIDRTFPDMMYFNEGNEGYKHLYAILRCIALHYKKLDGYIQGMNFVVGTLLLNLREPENAFWMSIQLLTRYRLDELFNSNFYRYKILCYQLDMFLLAYIPQMYAKFENLGFSAEYYAS
jgi:hypothetical protein